MELCEIIPPDWEMTPGWKGVQLMAPTEVEAKLFFRGSTGCLSEIANRLHRDIEIGWQGCAQPLQIKSEPRDESMPINTTINPLSLKPDANYQAIMEWVLEWWGEGLSVCITSQIDDKCLFQNDHLTTSRAVLQPHEFIGQNYRWYWRDSMDDYRNLQDRLDLDGNIPGFEYRLRRPDGALCWYATTYYAVEEFLGVPCRIGVSRLEDWQMEEAA